MRDSEIRNIYRLDSSGGITGESSRSVVTIRSFMSSVANRARFISRHHTLDVAGTKDMLVVFLYIGFGVFWALIYWSFTLGNERKTIPSNISLNAASAWEAELQINGTLLCSRNITLPWNLSENSNSTLTITATVPYYDIASCLGWATQGEIFSVFLYVSLLVRYTLTTLVIFYKITDIGKFTGKELVRKLTGLWLIAVCLYVIARIAGDITESYIIFLCIYCLAIPQVLSRKMMRCFSVEYKISLRWWSVWLICMISTNVITAFPLYGESYVSVAQVFLPLILTALDVFACKSVELSFHDHPDNHNGQAILMALYVWRMEVARFDCFIALCLGWESGNVPLHDVCLNAAFSILGEIWAHAGVREVGEDWFEKNVTCIKVKSDDQIIRHIFGSLRAVLEWVLPAITFSILCLLQFRRNYLAVLNDEIVIQLWFFTSRRIFELMIPILLVYYSLEFLCLFICWLLKKCTGYKQKSILATLGWNSIILLGIGVVSLQDVGFTGKFWSAVVKLN